MENIYKELCALSSLSRYKIIRNTTTCYKFQYPCTSITRAVIYSFAYIVQCFDGAADICISQAKICDGRCDCFILPVGNAESCLDESSKNCSDKRTTQGDSCDSDNDM